MHYIIHNEWGDLNKVTTIYPCLKQSKQQWWNNHVRNNEESKSKSERTRQTLERVINVHPSKLNLHNPHQS